MERYEEHIEYNQRCEEQQTWKMENLRSFGKNILTPSLMEGEQTASLITNTVSEATLQIVASNLLAHQHSIDSGCQSMRNTFTSSLSIVSRLSLETEDEWEDEIDGPQSDISRIFRRHLFKLVEAIHTSGAIEGCVLHLYSEELVSRYIRDTVMDPPAHYTNVARAFQIVRCVEYKVIRGGEDKLKAFVEVLKNCCSTAYDIGREMIDELEIDFSEDKGIPIVKTQTPSSGDSNHCGEEYEQVKALCQARDEIPNSKTGTIQLMLLLLIAMLQFVHIYLYMHT